MGEASSARGKPLVVLPEVVGVVKDVRVQIDRGAVDEELADLRREGDGRELGRARARRGEAWCGGAGACIVICLRPSETLPSRAMRSGM